MNVKCEKCDREYVFDEARVGEKGALVRCTRCNHTFRIHRPGTTPPSAARTTPSKSTPAAEDPVLAPGWLIRQRSGQVITFESLATLQQWIASGKIGGEDELSRSGSLWRKLGTVPELQGLFESEAPGLPNEPALSDDGPNGRRTAAYPPPLAKGTIAAALGSRDAEPSSPVLDHGGFEMGPLPNAAVTAPAWAGPTEPMSSADSFASKAPRVPTGERLGLGDASPSPSVVMRRLSVAESDEDEMPVASWQRRQRIKLVLVVAGVAAAIGGTLAFLLLKDRSGAPHVPSTPAAASPMAPTAAPSPSPTAAAAPTAATPTAAAPTAATPTAAAPQTPSPAAPTPPTAETPIAAPADSDDGDAESKDEAATPKAKRPPSIKQLIAMARRARESNPRKALKLYDQALADGPNSTVHAGKGWAYLELGELSLAAREFHIAVRMGKKGDTLIGLGTAYRRLNQRANARAQFERYLKLYPDGPEANVARTNLERLK